MADGLSKFALVVGVAALALSGYAVATAVPGDVADRVDQLERTTAGLRDADLEGLGARIAAIEAGSSAAISPAEFGQLTQRVQELAGLVGATSSAQDETIGDLSSSVTDLADGLAAAEGSLATLRTETIAPLDARVTSLAEGLASAEEAATAMGQTLATVQTNLGTLSTANDSLTEEVGGLDTRLQALSGRVDAAATAESVDALSTSLGDLVAAGAVPVGTILPWYPEMAGGDLPAGYVICDGRAIEAGPLSGQATPDLRDRFLMGGEQAGETGGAREVTTGAAGGHTHELGDEGTAGEGAPGGSISEVEGHTHAVDVTPPYVSVVYVMRVE